MKKKPDCDNYRNPGYLNSSCLFSCLWNTKKHKSTQRTGTSILIKKPCQPLITVVLKCFFTLGSSALQKIRNEQVTGSNPAISSSEIKASEVIGGFFVV